MEVTCQNLEYTEGFRYGDSNAQLDYYKLQVFFFHVCIYKKV